MSPHRRSRATTRHRVTIGAAVLAVVAGGVVTRTVASADTAAPPATAAAACPTPPGEAAPAASAAQQDAAHAAGHAGHAASSAKQPQQQLSPASRSLQRRGETTDSRGVRLIWGDGQAAPAAKPPKPSPSASPSASPSSDASAQPTPSPSCTPEPGADPAPSAPAAPVAPPAAAPPALDILGNSCKGSSKLTPHRGLQEPSRCVSTEFGEVGEAAKNPSLLITRSPRAVRVNQGFDLVVSTRNLVRDRFLKAAQGGYYKESSFLTADGLVRGHFHTACRMLTTTSAAPDPTPAPAFFVATEDGKGGAQPDSLTIRVLGLPQTGLAQCAVWAGDGSHRVPMMERANQVPAFDVVRVRVLR